MARHVFGQTHYLTIYNLAVSSFNIRVKYYIGISDTGVKSTRSSNDYHATYSKGRRLYIYQVISALSA